MAKRFLIVHMDNRLQVFDADTERTPFLDRVAHYNKNAHLSDAAKRKMSNILDGRFEGIYKPDGVLERVEIGNAVTYIGTLGSDVDIKK